MKRPSFAFLRANLARLADFQDRARIAEIDREVYQQASRARPPAELTPEIRDILTRAAEAMDGILGAPSRYPPVLDLEGADGWLLSMNPPHPWAVRQRQWEEAHRRELLTPDLEEAAKAFADAVNTGTGILSAGKRIAPAGIRDDDRCNCARCRSARF